MKEFVDSKFIILETKMEASDERLETKVDTSIKELEAKMASQESRLI